METINSIDELRRNANSIAGLSYRAFENMSDIQNLADFTQIPVLSFECERRCSTRYLQARNLCQDV